MAAEPAAHGVAGTARHRLLPTYRWHALAFVVLNGVLLIANVLTGWPWWAFWPLLVTAFLLGIHYLLYKALSVDERWADERVEELNLKSYDRSHIENLKSRFTRTPDRGA
jgi:hypothetical protein